MTLPGSPAWNREQARRSWKCPSCGLGAGAADSDVEAHAKKCGFDPSEVPRYGEGEVAA